MVAAAEDSKTTATIGLHLSSSPDQGLEVKHKRCQTSLVECLMIITFLSELAPVSLAKPLCLSLVLHTDTTFSKL